VKDNATSHGWRAGVPADLGRLGYSAGEIKDITGDWTSTEQVEKYRKIGRRRAGRKANDGRRAGAITELHKLRKATATADEQDTQAQP